MIEAIAFALVLVIDAAYILVLVSISMPAEKPVVKKLPKISVIIAAREGKIVEKTLRMLKKIKGIKLEIIVAASDPTTLKIAKKYARVVKDRGVGKGAALNIAVRKATGKILYFLDEDMVVRKGTIQKVCSALNGNEIAVGYNLAENKDGLVVRVARLYLAALTKMQFGIYRLIGTTFVAGRNFAIYKKTLNKAGNFRNVLTEDLDLSFRLFARHRKVKFVHAGARDQAPSRFVWYIKQQQRWNVGASHALKAWKKEFHHHDLSILIFIVLVSLVPLASLAFLVLALAFKSYLFLSVVVLCFLICLSSSTILDRDEIALVPATFLLLIVVQSFAIIYSAVAKPKGWYRTPKK
ncbi:MAG: glycosyltransferase family 2 protein [Candidatus Aenigmarchaeota archaeon]|nr:glycosyltransferase family 2 protein [Candidatus Aenigmarchaeota archaeon]